MKFPSPYLTPKVQIDMLQRWVLFHSHLYYDMNDSVVSDEMFDNNCNQLVSLQKAHPDDFKRSTYYYAMSDFDGSTGYGYFSKLKKAHRVKIKRDINRLLKYMKEKGLR